MVLPVKDAIGSEYRFGKKIYTLESEVLNITDLDGRFRQFQLNRIKKVNLVGEGESHDFSLIVQFVDGEKITIGFVQTGWPIGSDQRLEFCNFVKEFHKNLATSGNDIEFLLGLGALWSPKWTGAATIICGLGTLAEYLNPHLSKHGIIDGYPGFPMCAGLMCLYILRNQSRRYIPLKIPARFLPK